MQKSKKAKIMSKKDRVTQALLAGEQLTAAQISSRFGLANPRATISDIRFSGFPIYANRYRDSNGRETTKYRLGRASRKVVAAGYKALALGLI